MRYGIVSTCPQPVLKVSFQYPFKSILRQITGIQETRNASITDLASRSGPCSQVRGNHKVRKFWVCKKLRSINLIDLHPLSRRRSADRWHLGVVRLAVVLDRLVVDVRLETFVEVVCAHARNNDCEDEQEDCEHCEGSQRLAGGLVVVLAVQISNVHADELEQEVTHGNEVHHDNGNHTGNGLPTDPPGSEEEEEEGNNQGNGSESELDRLGVLDHDQELHGKGKEEKKSNFSSAM
jgi:hypothetical protein